MDYKNIRRVHLFERLGQKILFDPEIFDFYRLDDLSFTLLTQAQQAGAVTVELEDNWRSRYGAEEVQQRLEEFGLMKLFQPEGSFFKPAPAARDRTWSVINLHVTHNCNLNCSYCYARQDEMAAKPADMAWETARSALDLLNSHDPWVVKFNGGEPLIKFDLMRKCVEYISEVSRQKDVEVGFEMITNGILLDSAKADFIRKHGFNIAVSLDGKPIVHDAARPAKDGRSSQAGTLAGIGVLKEAGIKAFSFNTVLDRHQKNITETLRYLKLLEPRSISIIPADHGKTTQNIIKDGELFSVEHELEAIARLWLEWRILGQSPIDSAFTVFLNSILSKQAMTFGCSAGVNYIAAGPDGRYYPCHMLVGIDALAREGADPSWPELERIHVDDIEACASCWARYICGGGCPASNYLACGSFTTPNAVGCQTTKILIELAVAAFSQLPKEIRQEIIREARGNRNSRKGFHD